MSKGEWIDIDLNREDGISGEYTVRYKNGEPPFKMWFRAEKSYPNDIQWYISKNAIFSWGGRLPDQYFREEVK